MFEVRRFHSNFYSYKNDIQENSKNAEYEHVKCLIKMLLKALLTVLHFQLLSTLFIVFFLFTYEAKIGILLSLFSSNIKSC